MSCTHKGFYSNSIMCEVGRSCAMRPDLRHFCVGFCVAFQRLFRAGLAADYVNMCVANGQIVLGADSGRVTEKLRSSVIWHDIAPICYT